MRCWHHNILSIVKNTEFMETLLRCLNTLEPDRDNKLLLEMLKNYFSSRNKGFGSNWIPLPDSRAVLHVNDKGIYIDGSYIRKKHIKNQIDHLNVELKNSIGFRKWTIAFKSPFYS